MCGRTWIQIPVVGGTTPGEPVQPKHPIETNALVVYRGQSVYAALEENDALDRIAQLPDVRRLAPDEAVHLEATFPGGVAFRNHEHARVEPSGLVNKSGRVGLGDLISWVTSRFRLQECGPCSQRKKLLNKVPIWRSRRQ